MSLSKAARGQTSVLVMEKDRELFAKVDSSDVGNSGRRDLPIQRRLVHIGVRILGKRCSSFEQAKPPTRRIHWATPVVCRRINIVEEVPDCDDVSIGLLDRTINAIDLLWPTTIPHSSSFGQWLCSTTLKAISTHGNHGALNVRRPKKLSLVSGLRRLQM
jgi:hypothetical protein